MSPRAHWLRQAA